MMMYAYLGYFVYLIKVCLFPLPCHATPLTQTQPGVNIIQFVLAKIYISLTLFFSC